MIKQPIEGVLPPMITPFKENGAVDYDGHVRNMGKWNEDQLSGYVVLGSNSETAYLNEKEKIKLIELTVKHALPDRFILAGTGMESVRETISLTNKAADMGVDGALLLTPFFYYGHMNDEAMIAYFSEVADNVKIPVFIYNVSKFTHISISPHAVGILSQHPNIIGLKDSDGNIPQLVNFQNVMAKDFNLMVGTVSAWYPALLLGIKAGIFASANCMPNECALIQREFNAGNIDKAREIYMRIFPVNTAVTATYGVAGLKFVSSTMGYHGGYVRSPLQPLKDIEKENMTNILKTAKLL
ncbi:dihydrodipicolinate synthase family protein [Thermodesulfobacteriota bacterium]